MKQGWETKKIGEVVQKIFAGGDKPHMFSERQTDICCVPVYGNGVTNDGLCGYTDHYVVNERCLTVSARGTVGYCCVRNEPFVPIVRLITIIPQESIGVEYLCYALSTIDIENNGVAIPQLTVPMIKNVSIPVPPIAEQEKIVAELDCISGIIEKKKQQLKELDNLAQSIFYEMFGDPVENDKGWEVKKLGEVCDVRDGTHDSPKYLEHSEYVLVTSKNITSDGDIDFTTANYISKEDYDAINKRSYVDFGDIIMAMIGTIGKPIIVKETSRKFCIKNVALIKFEESTSVTNTYIQALLSNNSYASYIQGNNKGGTQKFIALGTIRKLLTPIPPLTLQQEFASKIESIEKQKELIAQSIKEAETLFNSRMDYYFS